MSQEKATIISEPKLPASMKVAIMHGPGDVRLEEMPVPSVGEGQLLVQLKATALCTMEKRVFSGHQPMSFPWVGGHEMAGVVVAVGPGTTSLFKVGDLVSVNHTACGQCDFCRRGFPARCVGQDLRTHYRGLSGGWGLAEYRLATPDALFHMADDLAAAEAALAEPLACAVHALRTAAVELADDVVIIGAGPMGLLNLMVCKLRGARVIVCDLDEGRCAKARTLGADEVFNLGSADSIDAIRELTDGLGADVVIAAVGSQMVDEIAFSLVRKTGKVILFAASHPSFSLSLDHNFLHKGEIRVLGVEGKNVDDFRIAARLLSHRLLSVRPLIEAELPLTEIQQALELACQPQSYRVVVTF